MKKIHTRNLYQTLSYLLLGIGFLSIFACSIEDDYSHDPCHFIFDTNIHITSLIRQAIDPHSSNVFVMVSYSSILSSNKVVGYNIHTQLNSGKENPEKVTTAQEINTPYKLGIQNGLIIGWSSYNSKLYAYDALCPNCLEKGIFNKLTWGNPNFYTTCKRCGRSYDLNNNGIVIKGQEGRKLEKYHIQNHNGVIIVSN